MSIVHNMRLDNEDETFLKQILPITIPLLHQDFRFTTIQVNKNSGEPIELRDGGNKAVKPLTQILGIELLDHKLKSYLFKKIA